MFNIIFSEKVKNDFKSINEFIANDNPVYVIKTIDSIMRTIDLLVDFPYIGKAIEENLREITEVNYKYKIVYIINNKKITILSVYKYQQYWQ